MTYMERIPPSAESGAFAVIRLLRHYCRTRDRRGGDADGRLSRLVALGQTLRLAPAASVALASLFQLTEAVLGRPLHAGAGSGDGWNGDERAVIRLLCARLPTVPGTGTPDIPHGLPGALTWAVLSVRRLCGELAPAIERQGILAEDAGCPFHCDPLVPSR
jgi:hypothetical protein